MRFITFAWLVGAVLLTACKQHEEAARDVGANVAETRLQEPIKRARQVATTLEKGQSVLFDPASNVFHKTSCRNADSTTMEVVTAGAARERGGKRMPAASMNLRRAVLRCGLENEATPVGDKRSVRRVIRQFGASSETMAHHSEVARQAFRASDGMS